MSADDLAELAEHPPVVAGVSSSVEGEGLPVDAAVESVGEEDSHVTRGSVWLMVVFATESLGGFLFLNLAARNSTTAAIGLTTGLYTSLQFTNYLSGLGLDVMLARFAARHPYDADRLFGWAVLATAAGSLLTTIGLIVPQVNEAVSSLHSPVGFVYFFAITACSSVVLLVSVRLMVARKWGWLLARVVLVSAIRLPLVFVQPSGLDRGQYLFAVMAVPVAASGIIGVLVLPRITGGRVAFGRTPLLGPAGRFAGVNWVAALAFSAAQFTLPVIVVRYVSESVYANFYVAWSLTQPIYYMPGAIHQVLLVEGSRLTDPVALRKRCFEALALTSGLSILAFLGGLVLARLIPTLYGPGYDEAVRLLPLLLLGGIPWSVAVVRLAEARIHRDHVTTVAITGAFGLGIVGLAFLLVPGGGTTGAAQAWLIGNVSAAAISLTLGELRGANPWLLRRRQARSTTTPDPATAASEVI